MKRNHCTYNAISLVKIALYVFYIAVMIKVCQGDRSALVKAMICLNCAIAAPMTNCAINDFVMNVRRNKKRNSQQKKAA